MSETAVHCVEPSGVGAPVHWYQHGDYGLEDIPELFLVGRRVDSGDGPVRLRLSAKEIRELKVHADAYSFDFEEGLIDLCVDLYDFASTRSETEFTFAESS